MKETFWEMVARVAESARRLQPWERAGVTICSRIYETYDQRPCRCSKCVGQESETGSVAQEKA